MTDNNAKDGRKPSTLVRMVALAVACVTGTLLFSWATAPHLWWSVVCAVLMIGSATFLAVCDCVDED